MSNRSLTALALFTASGLAASGCVATVKGRATTGSPPPSDPPPVTHRHHEEPPPPPPPAPAPDVRDHRDHARPEHSVVVKAKWDRAGWEKMGEAVVEGKNDRFTISIDRRSNVFKKLMVVVEDSDLELADMVVHFSKGTTFEPPLRKLFREDDRTAPIDLPGEARTIRTIDFKASNLPGGGRARIEVWGRN